MRRRTKIGIGVLVAVVSSLYLIGSIYILISLFGFLLPSGYFAYSQSELRGALVRLAYPVSKVTAESYSPPSMFEEEEQGWARYFTKGGVSPNKVTTYFTDYLDKTHQWHISNEWFPSAKQRWSTVEYQSRWGSVTIGWGKDKFGRTFKTEVTELVEIGAKIPENQTPNQVHWVKVDAPPITLLFP